MLRPVDVAAERASCSLQDGRAPAAMGELCAAFHAPRAAGLEEQLAAATHRHAAARSRGGAEGELVRSPDEKASEKTLGTARSDEKGEAKKEGAENDARVVRRAPRRRDAAWKIPASTVGAVCRALRAGEDEHQRSTRTP